MFYESKYVKIESISTIITLSIFLFSLSAWLFGYLSGETFLLMVFIFFNSEIDRKYS